MTAEQLTAISSLVMAIATLALVFAAIRALGQISEAQKGRHAVTATDFSRRWDDPDMIETRALVGRYSNGADLKARFFYLYDKHPGNPEYLQMLRQANYLEDLAILLEREAVDYDFIKRSLGHIVTSRWELWEQVADEWKVRNDIDNYPAFRALAARLNDEPDLS